MGTRLSQGLLSPSVLSKSRSWAHEVEVGRDVGFLHLHNVISIIHRQIELLHKAGHSHSDRAVDAS